MAKSNPMLYQRVGNLVTKRLPNVTPVGSNTRVKYPEKDRTRGYNLTTYLEMHGLVPPNPKFIQPACSGDMPDIVWRFCTRLASLSELDPPAASKYARGIGNGDVKGILIRVASTFGDPVDMAGVLDWRNLPEQTIYQNANSIMLDTEKYVILINRVISLHGFQVIDVDRIKGSLITQAVSRLGKSFLPLPQYLDAHRWVKANFVQLGVEFSPFLQQLDAAAGGSPVMYKRSGVIDPKYAHSPEAPPPSTVIQGLARITDVRTGKATLRSMPMKLCHSASSLVIHSDGWIFDPVRGKMIQVAGSLRVFDRIGGAIMEMFGAKLSAESARYRMLLLNLVSVDMTGVWPGANPRAVGYGVSYDHISASDMFTSARLTLQGRSVEVDIGNVAILECGFSAGKSTVCELYGTWVTLVIEVDIVYTIMDKYWEDTDSGQAPLTIRALTAALATAYPGAFMDEEPDKRLFVTESPGTSGHKAVFERVWEEHTGEALSEASYDEGGLLPADQISVVLRTMALRCQKWAQSIQGSLMVLAADRQGLPFRNTIRNVLWLAHSATEVGGSLIHRVATPVNGTPSGTRPQGRLAFGLSVARASSATTQLGAMTRFGIVLPFYGVYPRDEPRARFAEEVLARNNAVLAAQASSGV
uniref:Uncharacterized protein n=1 Tax=viral metagenome TaxID=1070528 RepID=A0A2V0RAJ0_9ZZZZ